jgi:hypothetical protein
MKIRVKELMFIYFKDSAVSHPEPLLGPLKGSMLDSGQDLTYT